MNRYGRTALDHWRRHRSQALASMADPVSRFRRLGEEVETRVVDLVEQILREPPPGEDLTWFSAASTSTAASTASGS